VFGDKPYELITDGVYEQEIDEPATTTGNPITIYFAGLLHMGYVPLFNILADALDELSKQGCSFKLLLRATQHIGFLDNRSFQVEYEPFSTNDAELKAELNSADILYLPIKFSDRDFYLYSLSTKMVGYLGAPGATLYHGPADSAACHLLQHADCAICCSSLDKDELITDVQKLITDRHNLSQKAKILARDKFNLEQIQARFWQEQ
jgi:hypothetical protein